MAAMPRMRLDPPRIRAAHAAMRQAQKAQARVINHGDMHLGNLYVDAEGTPGFLDAQPRLGAWSIDVSYFLIAGLDLVARRRSEVTTSELQSLMRNSYAVFCLNNNKRFSAMVPCYYIRQEDYLHEF